MRSYGMYDVTRGLTLALFAGLAGLGLWGAAQIGTTTAGRFWLAMLVIAGAGLLVTLGNLVGTWTKGLRMRMSPSTFVAAFLPVLIVVGWILLASQPGSGWEEGRITSWSTSMGILGAVHAIGLWAGVLAFGFGVTLGMSLDGVPQPAVEPEAGYEPATGQRLPAPTSDEPVTAERRWATRNRRRTVPTPQVTTPTPEETTRVGERTQVE